ncbi:MAG: YggT family protein [Pseudomonadota bacterium]|nr:YggT family protein [Pseudomonadota bacterium]
MDLYLLVFGLRLAMQWVRSDYQNPLVRFALKVTDPIVEPLRKFIPNFGKHNPAAVIIYVLLIFCLNWVLLSSICQITPDMLSMLAIAILRGIRVILSIYLFLIFAYVILSWVSVGSNVGFNPSLINLSNLVSGLVYPILIPIRKFIPPIGGLDLSPIAVIIIIGALRETTMSFAIQLSAIGCPLRLFI